MALRNKLAAVVHANKNRVSIRVVGRGLMAVPGSTYNGSVYDVAQPSGWCGTATCVSTTNDPAGVTVFVTNHHVMGSSGSKFHKIFADIDGRLVKLTPCAWHTVEPKTCDRGMTWRISDVAVVKLEHTDLLGEGEHAGFSSPFKSLPVAEQQPHQDFWAIGHPNGTKQTAVSSGAFAVMEAMPQFGGWRAAAPVMSQFALPTTHGNSGGPIAFFKDGDPKKMTVCSLVAWGFEKDQTRSYGVPYFAIQNILRATGAQIAKDGTVTYAAAPQRPGYMSVRRGVVHFTKPGAMKCDGMIGTWSGRLATEPMLQEGVSTLKKVDGISVSTQLGAMMQMQKADSTKPLRLGLENNKGEPYEVAIPSSCEIAAMKSCHFLENSFRGLDRDVEGACVQIFSAHGEWQPVLSASICNTGAGGKMRQSDLVKPLPVTSTSLSSFVGGILGSCSKLESFTLSVNGETVCGKTTMQKELQTQMRMGTMPTFLELSDTVLKMSLMPGS